MPFKIIIEFRNKARYTGTFKDTMRLVKLKDIINELLFRALRFNLDVLIKYDVNGQIGTEYKKIGDLLINDELIITGTILHL